MLSRRHSSARLPEILLIAHSELHIAVRIALSLPRSPSTLPAHDIVRLVQTPQHRFPTSPRLELPNDVPPPLAPQLVFALIRTQDISVLSKVIQLLNAISRCPPPHLLSLSLSLSSIIPSPHIIPTFAIQRGRDKTTHLGNIPHIPHDRRHSNHVDKRDQSGARRPAEVFPPVGGHVWSRVSALSLSTSFHLISSHLDSSEALGRQRRSSRKSDRGRGAIERREGGEGRGGAYCCI